MRLGINQSSLDPNDLERTFELARQCGADGVELTCEQAKDLAALLGKKGPARINQLKQEFQLEVPSIGLCLLKKAKSLFGPPKVADQAERFISKAVATAGQMGARVILVPFFEKATIELESELQAVLEALAGLAEQAEEAGLTLGIESTLNVNQQLHMMESLGNYTSVKVYYDTGIALSRKWDPATYLRDLGRDSICQVHFKDVRLGEEGSPPDWQAALGQGDVDFPAIASALRAMGYDDWIILETPATQDPLAAGKANVKFVRQLLS